MAPLATATTIKSEQIIPAPPDEVFDAWLDSTIPGTPFHEHEKLIVNLKVDGLWYWLFKDQPHFGRFTEIVRPGRIRHTWTSLKTLGLETMVTVTFQRKKEGTLMNLVHSGFSTADMSQAHEKAWGFILARFAEIFGRTGK